MTNFEPTINKPKTNWSEKSLFSGFRLYALLLFLVFAAAASYFLISPKSHVYFLNNNRESNIKFNNAVLSNIFKDFSDIPYNYSQSFSQKKAPGVYRIFIIGEASLSGWPYSREQAIDKKIQYNLSKYVPAEKFEIITISFAGLNTTIAFEIVSSIFRYTPDLVIIYSGHNEFYCNNSNPNSIKRLFDNSRASVPVNYDSNSDDLELLIPLNAKVKLLNNKQQEYWNVIERYEGNITRIAELCKENKTGLIISDLADNYLMPPVGIASYADQNRQLSADIIFNNARMALLRDGNEVAAEKLFNQSKELDAFRLRIPADLSRCLNKIAGDSGFTLAVIKSKFVELSQNHIPGNDLFVDYIHPNKLGLDIIAAEYTRLIFNKFIGYQTTFSLVDLIENQQKMIQASTETDLQLEKLRIEKAMWRLKDTSLFRHFSSVSVQ